MKQEFSEDQGYFKSGIYKMSLDEWFAGGF